MKVTPIQAVALITPSRLDIAAKTLVARSLKTGLGRVPADEIYRATLSAMNPTGKFGEDNKKFSLDDYENSFKELFSSLSDNGFDPSRGLVPLSRDGSLQNGAHRVAIAAILGLDVATQKTDDIPQVYDFQYFQKAGLEYSLLRRLAWEYLGLENRTRAILLSGFSESESLKIANHLRKSAGVVCYDSIRLTEIGKRRLMDAAYGHLSWYANDLREKLVIERFSAESTAHLILFVPRDDTHASEIKEHLRNRFMEQGQFERRIHGSDNYEETVRIARAFLLKGQRAFLNWSPLGAEDPILERVMSLPDFQKSDLLAFDGGAVVEMFGIRTTQDLDHICVTKGLKCAVGSRHGDCHNHMYAASGLDVAELLNNPDETFEVQGIKFMNSDLVALSKRFRGEGKDLADSQALENIQNQSISDGSAFATSDSAKRARKWKRRSQLMIFVDKVLSLLPKPLRKQIARIAASIRSAK